MSGDAIGTGGTVRLRAYLPHANVHWFAAGCGGGTSSSTSPPTSPPPPPPGGSARPMGP
jgi:hypothetical protein